MADKLLNAIKGFYIPIRIYLYPRYCCWCTTKQSKYRVDSIRAKPTLTNRNSMVSKS